MQPIKTINAMNPAPAKGIESFPTPVIDDVVISEIVNSWKGDYQPLEYGVLWKDVSHAPNQGSFPEHKLVYQQPTSEDGQWVKRIWVNDRVNQDSYNYAIKYSAGSQDHPIYIRTYIVPREGYAPLPDGTPDPLFPGALLVDEEANRNEGELDSKYITVTRVYETLPGPEVPTKRYNERGDLETVIVQTVPPNTPPTADGLLVTQSQVEQVETGKGVKTTATVQDHALLQIKEKKEGLLGETITTDDIVDPSTNPDALSQTIVASVVEQYTATKARKRTTTASGPASLAQKSKDGKLLGDVTSTESVVAPNTNPDSVSSTILSSEVRQVDSGKAIKRNVVLNSTPTLSGRQNEQGLLGIKSTTESIVAAGSAADSLSLSVISSTVEPIDSVRSRKVTITSSSPSSLFGGQKKEGLLGETSVDESIVEAGTQPDALSQTIVSSVVEPIDSAKSRKVTITSTGPIELTERNKDGKILGDTTAVETIVAPNTLPDPVNSVTLSSQVKKIDNGKAIKTNVYLNSTPTLLGGQSGEGLLGSIKTTERIVSSSSNPDPVSLTVISSQIEPIDSVRSRKITTESTGPTSLSGGQKKEGLLGETVVNKSIVAAGTAPDALSQSVISSVIEPIDSAKSQKTTITRIGPASLTESTKDGKLLGNTTLTESIVPPDTLPDDISSNILSSQVKQIDSGKAIKTNIVLNDTPTLFGKQNVEGLFGQKYITETIVSDGSPPDPLSFNVISSIIEPIDEIRGRKITVEASLPTILSSNSLVDSPIGLVDAVVARSIVPIDTAPSGSDTNIKDSITAIDQYKAEREQINVTTWPTNTGVDYDDQIGVGIFYTQTVVPASEYANKSWDEVLDQDIKPIDQWKSVKREIDRTKARDALLNQWYKIGTDTQITLPDKLTNVVVYWGRSFGNGGSYDFGSGAFTGSYNRNQSGDAKSSASIAGDIYFNIQKGFNGSIPGFQHIFFIEIGDDGSVSQGDVISRLNALEQSKASGIVYSNWPYLQLRSENLVLINGSTSITRSSSLSESVSINGSVLTSGSGQSYDVNVNANSINIPECLHDNITIINEFIGPEITGLNVTYGVQPSTLSETKAVINGAIVDAPKFPTGYYLLNSNVELYKYGFVKVTATTVRVTNDYV
jgi:hypothetical protein